MAYMIRDLEMFPYFYGANFIHKSSIIRCDACPDNFSRQHPFASYISTMVACFAGNMLANSLLGLPIVDPWGDSTNVLMATVTWYLMNYSPFDIFHTLSKLLPLRVIVGVMVEIFRCNRIYEGVNLGFERYDNSPLIILSIATICGNGIRFIELIHRLIRGLWNPNEVEFMMPSCDTRASFIVSLIFWMFYYDMSDNIYAIALALLLVLKGLCVWVGNPYCMVENLLYQLTIGIWETVSRLVFKKEMTGSCETTPDLGAVAAPCTSRTNCARRKSRSPSRKRSCSRRR